MSSCDNREITLHEFGTTNLQTFLNYLGGKLVDAVIVGVGKNVVDDTALIRWRTVLTQMLDAPIAKLAMSDKVNACNDFLDGGALSRGRQQSHIATVNKKLAFSSSTQFSKMFWTTKLPVSPSATSCHIPRRASLTLSMI